MALIEPASEFVFSPDAADLFCFTCWFLFGLEEFWLLAVEDTDEATDIGRLGTADIVVVAGISVDVFISGNFWNNINYINYMK